MALTAKHIAVPRPYSELRQVTEIAWESSETDFVPLVFSTTRHQVCAHDHEDDPHYDRWAQEFAKRHNANN